MTQNPAKFAALVAEANFAPSVHNTQPTRWSLAPDGTVLVLEDVARRLPVGDPEGRDADVSHGAAIEGFAMACAAQKLGAVRLDPSVGEVTGGLRPVARLTFSEGDGADPLRAAVPRRWTYRGPFERNDLGQALAPLETLPDVVLVRDQDAVAHLAEMNDTAGLRTFRNGAYRAELLSWMRLSKGDPRWDLDGLNAAAMQMSPVEAAAAGFVLRPGVFETLDKIGLSGALVAEAKVVRSAAAIALFHRPLGEAPLETGRRFYRFWLEVTAQGLAAAPMAVLADDRRTREEISATFNLAHDRRLITAFRLGQAPSAMPPGRPRLATSVLLA